MSQLLVPPAFIMIYGVTGYGEWLTLSAAVGYLGTFDFGLQTYVLNELTGLYHRNELERYHQVQSVGLRLVLILVCAGTLLACFSFILPLPQILRLQSSRSDVAWAVFWLAVQVLFNIPLGLLTGIYRTFGNAHRGVIWNGVQRIGSLAVTLGLIWLRAPFWLIAAGQVFASVLVMSLVVLNLRQVHREICPRLDYWDGRLAREILKPSSFFGLFMFNNFLVYQAPILILQRLLGPKVVVVFSVARTLFSFVRQGTAVLYQCLAPEITRLHGVGDQTRLVRLYLIFEAVVLATVLVVNAGLLMSGPVLLRFWLKNPDLFNLKVFVPVMVVSILLSVKEYKLYFQYATNHHARIGVLSSLWYLGMVLFSLPLVRWFGISGFTTLWLIVECVQLGVVHRQNVRFFARHRQVSWWPSIRLGFAIIGAILFAICAHPLLDSRQYLLQVLASGITMAALALVSYFIFDLRLVFREGKGQLRRAFA